VCCKVGVPCAVKWGSTLSLGHTVVFQTIDNAEVISYPNWIVYMLHYIARGNRRTGL
jgi:hypothetical protein